MLRGFELYPRWVPLKGYTVTEFKDLFLQRNSGRRRNENIILPRPKKQILPGTPYALEEQSQGTL